MLRLGWLSACAALACSPAAPAAPDTTPDASPPDVDSGAEVFVPASHDPPPPIPSNGGSVLASANVVVVTFADYPFADTIEAMADWLPTSQWLAATAAEYAVGTPSVLAKIRLAGAAPSFTSASDFTAWVASHVGAELPSPPSPSTLYVVVFPSGASFSDPGIGSMCGSFTGYHDAVAGAYTFAAIGTCPNHVPGLSDAEQVERVFSHEVVEALTDPFGDGYAARDPADPWSFVGGGEVADVCNGYWREGGFLAVRSWSNAAAAAGLDPCEPNAPGTPYFGLAASSTSTQHVAAGGSITLELAGFSSAPVSDWSVQVVEGSSDFTPTITFAPGPMNNGRSAPITIGVPASAASGQHAVVLLRSLHGGDAAYTLEPLAVRVD